MGLIHTYRQGGGVSVHSALTGLGVDDHAQYTLVDGSRGFTSTVSGVGPIEEYHLATKGYVDDAVVSGAGIIHGNLLGLDGDDHLQYHTDARGDARYYQKDEVDTISGSLQTNINNKPDTLLELTDTPSSYTNTYYLRSTVSGTEWFDVATISGATGATGPQGEAGASGIQGETGLQGPSGDDAPTTFSGLTDTPNVYDNGKYIRSTASGTEWASITGLTIHGNEYHDPDFASTLELTTLSGNLQTNIDGKSDLGHDHTESDITDLDKYTQAEVNTISGTLQSRTEDFTLDATDISNKYVELANTPSALLIFVEGGIKGILNTDYSLTTNKIDWDGKDWNGILEAGDILSALYWV